jgi:hypothetical protein
MSGRHDQPIFRNHNAGTQATFGYGDRFPGFQTGVSMFFGEDHYHGRIDPPEYFA